MTEKGAFAILVVCTGNICRSPAAERLLTRELSADLGVTVSSAGTHALIGESIAPLMTALLREDGIDTKDFSARMLTMQMLRDTNLVLTATRAHRAAVSAMHPPVVKRAFTLREFAAILSLPDAAARLSGVVPSARAADAVEWAGRYRGALSAALPRPEYDILDPYGHDSADYRTCLAQLGPAVRTIAAALNG